MVGITLMPERIRSAPPEVRRWLEQEIAMSLGFLAEGRPSAVPLKHLVACSLEEAAAIYGAIRDMLPVVNVFFELGREGQALDQSGIESRQLTDVLRHTRLQRMEQVIACLQVIDDAIRQIRGDASATLCALDQRGYCLSATETQRNIANLWQRLLKTRGLDQAPPISSTKAPLQEADRTLADLSEKSTLSRGLNAGQASTNASVAEPDIASNGPPGNAQGI